MYIFFYLNTLLMNFYDDDDDKGWDQESGR
jgi:hypothetical protein